MLMQREELELQREELVATREELRRSAEAQAASSEALAKQIEVMQLTARLNALSSLASFYKGENRGLFDGDSSVGMMAEIQSILDELKDRSGKLFCALHQNL